MKDLAAILESILFAHGEPLDIQRLAVVTEKPAEEVLYALRELSGALRGRGLVLIEKDGAWQLGSSPASARYVEKLVKSEFSEELSRAALETLAIIAYKGPLTRAEIEYIRGVNSSFTLQTLLMRGLAERRESPQDARSYLYRASFDFLKYLGLARIEDLPRYEELRKEIIPDPPQSAS